MAELSAKGRFTALLYHHVGPSRLGTHPNLTVSPDRFASHLAWLRRCGYRGLSIDQVIAWATEGRPIPGRSVLITFDDGYADLAEFAFPVLRRAGFPATVFLVSHLLGESNRWDLGHIGHRILAPAEVRSWSRRGIEFGAHTCSHPDLTGLSRAGAEREMGDSRSELEDLLERPVEAFAYPFGAIDETVCELAAQLFSVSFLAIGEAINRSRTERHLLRRSMVPSSDRAFDVVLRARFGYSAQQRARHRLAPARRAVRQRLGV